MRSPSWKISDMPPAMLPGAMPPMSAWCAMLQTNATSSARREHRHREVDVGQMRAAGDERIVGDEDVALVDLVRPDTSPAAPPSAPTSRRDGSAATAAPATISRPRRSMIVVEWSWRSLMLVE